MKKVKNPYEIIYFNIELLKNIYDNPEYKITNFDYKLNISGNSYSEDEEIFIDNIGLGYDIENKRRIIGIFLKYLSILPEKIQQRFKSYQIDSKCVLDPSFIKTTINGEWEENESIFDAILYEIYVINKICNKKQEIELFNKNFHPDINNPSTKSNERPAYFKIIILSTKKEYCDFINEFDKLISDNINKKFFEDKIEPNEYKDSGTINLLKKWLKSINIEENKIEKIIKPLQNIRKERNECSHRIYTNESNIIYNEKQIEKLVEIYKSLKILINVLINHFKLEYKPKDWFIQDKIRTYSINEFIELNNSK